MLDAVRHIKSLEATGFNREQAEAQVQLVYEAIGEEVASKTDISTIRSEMTKEFTAVRSEMAQEFVAIRSEMATGFAAVRSEMATKDDLSKVRSEMATKSDLAELKVEILYKMGALFVSSMTIATAIIGILIKF